MADIKAIKELALHAAKKTVPVEFANKTVADVNEALRGELQTLCGTYDLFRRNKLDLFEIMQAVAEERLSEINVEFYKKSACCVIMASNGYPEKYEKGKEITIGQLDQDVVLCHAGTAMKDGKLVTSGGRVLGVCARGKDIEEARKKAYANAEKIYFDGMYYRKDIGIKYRNVEKE
jgi:phosphoribosylamine--glycine ligase